MNISKAADRRVKKSENSCRRLVVTKVEKK